MAIDPLTRLGSLGRLQSLGAAPPAEAAATPASGFADVLNQLMAAPQQSNAAAESAIAALATGQAQDLHSVSLAVAQADLSFRLVLELRNRLTEAFQEVTRMQV